ncbi:hypothetical protein PsorP6_007367 [Peronosclerospora sorghi]|uniref:Uncharacterized protein n=1 Tax=Peronosclerospora sorghi TaxID=230839 RepID=A0ACC0WCD8_9STRA|nr:hypothetical protein PsorP6_007367 [Peronosclerospora sorghi]
MLFNSNASLQEMPARGTSTETLQEIYFKPQWIAHEMLATVKLHVLAQYDRFAVIHAIFRTIPKLRLSITAAAASTSLAIFQYQGLETVFCQNTDDLVTAWESNEGRRTRRTIEPCSSNYEFEVRLEIAATLIPSAINLKNMKIAVIFCRRNGLRSFGHAGKSDSRAFADAR